MLKLRRRIAPLLLALTMMAFGATWYMDPYVFGMTVVGMGTAAFAVGAVGLLMRAARPQADDTRLLRIVDVALVIVPLIGLAVVRTIKWA